MAERGRRLAAVMFTDIVGYSALTQANESLAMEVLDRHNQLLRSFFGRFGGREVKTIGDAFLVEFESALSAVRCAVELQSYLHDYNMSSGRDWKIMIRIGIHLGDVIESGADILGDAVNIASRIEPLAEPGGVCVSAQVYDQVHNRIEQPLISMGEKSLKNIAEPMRVYKVGMPWEDSGPAVLDRRRVAVLPFVSISPDPGDEYFADGLTEELIGRLSMIGGLEVIARTSVMNYKKNQVSVSQIGRELKVGTVLEGSVRKAGNRIRVTTQLIDTATEGHLWTDNYDRGLEDIFAVQTEVAEKVASSLEAKLTSKGKMMMDRRRTSSTEAYTLYLKGRFQLIRYDEEALLKSIKHFEAALTMDGNYALAYCGLSIAHFKLGLGYYIQPREAYRKARCYAEKAISLEPMLPEAHLALALTQFADYDIEGALKELERTIALDPNFADAYEPLALIYVASGKQNESLRCVQRRLQLDPLSVSSTGTAGTICLYFGRHDEAIKHLRDALELDPTNTLLINNLGLAYVQKGMVEEGLAMMRKAVEASGRAFNYSDLGYVLVKSGRADEARTLLAELLQSSENQVAPSTSIAGLYAVLGEKDKAMDWLEKAYEERSSYLPLTCTDFVFDSLRGEERYRTLLKKMGLPVDSDKS